jgi:Pentapeptide repeats (8 copies)
MHASVNRMAQILRIYEPIKMKTKGDGDSAISKGEKKMKGYRMRPWPSVGAALLASFLIYMVPGVVSTACEDPPAPQVNWANCNKKSASLVNADLRGANLRQTNLMGAALGNINLQGADLTEATHVQGGIPSC